MRAVVKMDITLFDSRGRTVAHDNNERVYETMVSDSPSMYAQYNKHIEELNFKWVALIENDIH